MVTARIYPITRVDVGYSSRLRNIVVRVYGVLAEVVQAHDYLPPEEIEVGKEVRAVFVNRPTRLMRRRRVLIEDEVVAEEHPRVLDSLVNMVGVQGFVTCVRDGVRRRYSFTRKWRPSPNEEAEERAKVREAIKQLPPADEKVHPEVVEKVASNVKYPALFLRIASAFLEERVKLKLEQSEGLIVTAVPIRPVERPEELSLSVRVFHREAMLHRPRFVRGDRNALLQRLRMFCSRRGYKLEERYAITSAYYFLSKPLPNLPEFEGVIRILCFFSTHDISYRVIAGIRARGSRRVLRLYPQFSTIDHPEIYVPALRSFHTKGWLENLMANVERAHTFLEGIANKPPQETMLGDVLDAAPNVVAEVLGEAEQRELRWVRIGNVAAVTYALTTSQDVFEALEKLRRDDDRQLLATAIHYTILKQREGVPA